MNRKPPAIAAVLLMLASLCAGDEPKPAPDEPRGIVLKLVDRDTRLPLRGARVRWAQFEAMDQVPVQEEGKVTIPVDPAQTADRMLQVSIQQPTYVPIMLVYPRPRSAPPPAEQVVELESGMTVGGIVQDEAGNPVEGATIWLNVPDRDRKPNEFLDIRNRRVKTDAKGRWAYHLMPNDLQRLEIRAIHPGFLWGDYRSVPPQELEQMRQQAAVTIMKKGRHHNTQP